MIYNWDKMTNDAREMFYKLKVWIGHTKKQRRK